MCWHLCKLWGNFVENKGLSSQITIQGTANYIYFVGDYTAMTTYFHNNCPVCWLIIHGFFLFAQLNVLFKKVQKSFFSFIYLFIFGAVFLR